MEGLLHSNSGNSKIPRFNGGLNGGVLMPMQMDNQLLFGKGRHSYIHHHQQSKSPTLAGSYNENLDLGDSPLVRYFRTGSPDSYKRPPLLENLEMARSPSIFSTPVKVEEEVLVMDGILVASLPPGGRYARSATDSGDSTTSSSSSSGGKSLYKTEICRSWEDSGSCRYGSKCQFAHGKEELRPTRFPAKNKSEAQMYKSSSGTGSGTYGAKSRYVHPVVAAAGTVAAAAGTMPTRTRSPAKAETASPRKPEDKKKKPKTTITRNNWSPQDDGIETVLPHSSSKKPPSRTDVDTHIDSILYGPTPRKRLAVFADIRSER
ncbi:hypothetical protein I3843_06G144000 [Carya illinoinensis]|nr:hypothetical protein I3760_06G152900 [Carya illinoinensis]KAG2703779.1 hypothetical protein I3760_06G152900 [Carya illinoinensis]KAG7976335.1 hypothetical protein I3843_06G144000 [Carya illinoinensis]KAG7976336.1 hypothetical protein I3843_06G144000 [Carya illinoinensis]